MEVSRILVIIFLFCTVICLIGGIAYFLKKRELWKPLTIFLFSICLLLGSSVYDAESRVHLLADERHELYSQITKLDKIMVFLELDDLTDYNKLEITTSVGDALIQTSNKKLFAEIEFNGNDAEKEFCAVATLSNAFSQSYEEWSMVYFVDDEYGIVKDGNSILMPTTYKGIDITSPKVADKFRDITKEIFDEIT